jgi:hypothetical protein
MKRTFILLAFLVIGNPCSQKSFSAPGGIQAEMQFGFFYSSLSPHGEWIQTESGFHVWRPLRIGRYWRPYQLGRWIWTDYGWYWMSDESFGWITYHYGRWYYDDYYGWLWMPDDVWGPAWVEWRYDDNYIGWAPLPPYAVFGISVGIHFTHHWIAPVRYWNFVRYRSFGKTFRHRDFAPESYTRRLIRTTRSGSRYDTENNRIINRGVDRTIIERQGRIRIHRVAVQEDRRQRGERLVRSGNRSVDRIEIYHPSPDELKRPAERPVVRKADRKLSIDMGKIGRRQEASSPSPSGRTESNRTGVENRRQGTEIRGRTDAAKPRIREQRQPRSRREKRDELIRRYGSGQNPSPPTGKDRGRRIERERNTRSDYTRGSSSSGRNSTRNKNR